jgi:guanylate kinase
MTNNGLLIVISGPSGAGKGTICKALSEDQDLWISVSATTREPRSGEIDGVNYFFLNKQEFIDKINEDDFFEYAEVYGNYYGTPKWKTLEAIYSGKDVVLEIDIQGALKVKQQYPEGVFIFILPPSMEELKQRIINRGTETEESLRRRFKS